MTVPSQIDAEGPLWWTILNAGWFGLLVGSAIGLAGLYAAWFFYHRAKSRPSIQYTADSTLLVGTTHEAVADKLEITFGGRKVPQVTSTVFGMWNDGNTTFRAADVADKDPIKLRFENGTILQANVDSASRDVIGAEAKLVEGASEVIISFAFLEPKDALTISILHSSPPGDAFLTGTIIGLPNGLQYFRPGRRGAAIERWVDRAFYFFVGFLFLAIFLVIWTKNGWAKALLLPVSLSVIVGPVLLLIAAISRHSNRWSKAVPPSVLGNSQLSRRMRLEKLYRNL